MAIRWAKVLEHAAEDWIRIFLYTGIGLFPFLWAVYQQTGVSLSFILLVRTEVNILFGMGVASFLSMIAILLEERDGRA